MSAQTGWLDEVNWTPEGLVPAIVQDAASGAVLMFAWMNRVSLEQTATTGAAVYWSRSRGRLWRKGEESGNTQRVKEIRLDCDQDAIVLVVDQLGGIACHTGHQRCFFRKLEAGHWVETEPVLRDPRDMYRRV